MSPDILGFLSYQIKRMLILIVDSSIQVIERLEELVSEAEDITVVHRAVSCEEAEKLLKRNKYDVILLDIDLIIQESLKLLKEIKKYNEKSCVIVLFTQIGNYTQEQCKSLGVDFFFDKYYDFEKICGVIDSLSFVGIKKE